MNTEDFEIDLRIDSTFTVDTAKSELRDLAIMTGGREAAGHGIYLDQKTIDSAFACVQASGGQLRAAIRHPSVIDMLTKGRDRVLDMPGYFSDVRVDGNKLVAGKFQFFDSFKAQNPTIVARIIEMADKTPKLFGLSAEPAGPRFFVGKDGQEYAAKRDPKTDEWQKPVNVELANQGLPTLRVKHLGVAAFVDQPAANDGVFAKLSSLFGGKQSDLSAVLQEFGAAIARGMANSTTVAPAAIIEGNTFTPLLSETTPPTMLTFPQITAKFGADKARLTQALELASQNPEITIEALETKLSAAEFAALGVKVTNLTAELATATKTLVDLKAAHATALTALTAERDSFKTKFEAIKNSGLPGDLNLGAGADATGGENPWAKETVNLTRQVEITNANPVLAASLKAAAAIAKK